MIQFIKDAFTELEHIVWPTPNESRKYMLYTIGAIVIVSIFLAIAGYFLRTGLVATRAQFPHEALTQTSVSGEDLASQADVQEILDKVQLQNKDEVSTVSTGSLTPDSASGTNNN